MPTRKLTYKLREVAELIGRHPNTIRRYIKSGQLKASRVGELGDYHISRADLAAWWRVNGGGELFEDAPEDTKDE